jgi:prepilin-type N-terminal cleavage/methylation domain-containing protein
MTKCLRKSGFTLIEVLAAMAVLMIIVLMLTRVFRDATSAWTIGTRQMEDNINGRAVLDFIARDIGTAIAGETNCVFYLKSSNPLPKWPNDEISFVSLTGNPSDGNREARQIVYYVTNMTDRSGAYIPNRYCLRRIMRNSLGEITCYTEKRWWQNATMRKAANDPVVAENVNMFLFGCAGATNDASGKADYWHGVFDFNSCADVSLIQSDYIRYTKSDTLPYMRGKLPVRLDVYLELLGEDAAIKVAQLRNAGLTAQADALVSQSVKKYQTRIYFSSRTGYPIDRTP